MSQYTTPPVAQLPNLQYTPSTEGSQGYNTPTSQAYSTPNSATTPTGIPGDGLPAAVTRKELLAQSLAKLRKEVDSLHTDSWMFEASRHTYH